MRLMPIVTAAAVASLAFLPASAAAPSAPSADRLANDERAPARAAPCFPGAIYRKAVSSVDAWTGIDVVLTLPTFVPDPARVDPATRRPLDNASCYIGGRAGVTEIDAGVSWEVIREPDGNVSKDRKAFRPFWRNAKWFSGPAKADFYFYPGDTIRLSCQSDADDKLTFVVQLLARAGQPVAAHPLAEHRVELDAPGFGPGRQQQFKRVTAIDQSANEGKPAQPTAARVAGARWSDVALLRGSERRPMTRERITDMRCPDPQLVEVETLDDAVGGERVSLRGRR